MDDFAFRRADLTLIPLSDESRQEMYTEEIWHLEQRRREEMRRSRAHRQIDRLVSLCDGTVFDRSHRELQKDKVLALADHMDSLYQIEYDQSSWKKCIAGHCVRKFMGSDDVNVIGDVPRVAQQILGLSSYQAAELFAGRDKSTPQIAAHVLRGLAHTGQVKWPSQY